MSKATALSLTFLVLTIWVGWTCYLIVLIGPEFTATSDTPFQNTGQFGDSFGVLASFMSTLAVIGALYSIHVQHRNYERQLFESNFYKLLDNLSREREGLSILIMGTPLSENLTNKAKYHQLKQSLREKRHVFEGNDCFQIILCRIRDAIGETGYRDTKRVAREYRKIMRSANQIKRHFRLLYHIFAILDRSPVNDKNFYARILRAHISQPEFCLLGYNCAIDEGIEKFKPLLEKYSLLHNLQTENLDEHERAELRFFERKFSSEAFRFEPPLLITY